MLVIVLFFVVVPSFGILCFVSFVQFQFRQKSTTDALNDPDGTILQCSDLHWSNAGPRGRAHDRKIRPTAYVQYATFWVPRHIRDQPWYTTD